MNTERSFVDYIVDQADLGDRLTFRPMFGEYGFHLDGIFVAMACDDSFFVKSTSALDDHGLTLPMRPPYPGAKPHPVADELLDDPERLRRLLLDTAKLLPASRPRKSGRRKPPNN